MKRRIALTGSIGSGKSTVAQILRQLGFNTVDCDEISREVADSPEVLQKVVELLGPECLSNGKLNRKFVRGKVFADENLHKAYSRIFWQEIARRLEQTVENLDVVFVEIPVVDAFPFDWQEIWLVESIVDAQIARVTARDGVEQDDVCRILRMQSSTCCYTRKISNDGSLEQLRSAVLCALSEMGLS